MCRTHIRTMTCQMGNPMCIHICIDREYCICIHICIYKEYDSKGKPASGARKTNVSMVTGEQVCYAGRVVCAETAINVQ